MLIIYYYYYNYYYNYNYHDYGKHFMVNKNYPNKSGFTSGKSYQLDQFNYSVPCATAKVRATSNGVEYCFNRVILNNSTDNSSSGKYIITITSDKLIITSPKGLDDILATVDITSVNTVLIHGGVPAIKYTIENLKIHKADSANKDFSNIKQLDKEKYLYMTSNGSEHMLATMNDMQNYISRFILFFSDI
jgi:hypothetical protein